MRKYTFSILILAATCAVSAGEPPPGPGFNEQKTYELKYRCWVPMEPDMNTFRLYRMEDEVSDQNIDLEAEDLDDGEEEEALGLTDATQQKGQPLADSSLLAKSALGRPARVEGAHQFVPEGRFGAGLRLKGPDSVVASPLSLSKYSLAVSGWFRPSKLRGTLLCVPSKGEKGRKGRVVERPPALECRLLEDGRIAVLLGGREVGKSDPAFALGLWKHVAVSYTYALRPPMGRGTKWHNEPTGVQALINGKPFFWLLGSHVQQLTQSILFGNNVHRDSPFVGVLDELHLAREDNGWYEWDRSLVDPESKRDVVDDFPYFRSKGDLCGYAKMDGSLDAALGNFGTALKYRREPEKPKPAEFTHGIRSKGVLSGWKKGVVSYQFQEKTSAREGSIEFWFSPHDWDNRRIYGIREPPLTMAILRVAYSSKEKENAPLMDLDIPLLTEVKRMKAGTAFYLLPGRWYHALVTWRGSSSALYVNGESANPEFFKLDFARYARGLPEDAVLSEVRFGEPSPVKLLGHRRFLYQPHSTVVDEFRFYRRRLSKSEALNAYRRYLPDAPVEELPYAEIALTMNYPRKLISSNVLVLARERDQVASIRLEVADEQGQVIADEELSEMEHGRSITYLREKEVGYGNYTALYTFLGKDGKALHAETLNIERPRPPWLHSTLGIHEGQVPPGWTDMAWSDGVAECWGREITIDGRGWPAKIVSQEKPILASPVAIRLRTDKGEVDLKAAAPKPELIKQQADIVVTRGKATASGWELTTTISTEFDGVMKVEATLAGQEGAEVHELIVEFPLRFAKDQLYGFWAGSRGFRGSCDYRKLPEGEGVVFRSNKTGRSHAQWQNRVSFIPYLAVCDDWRGFVWFAENDRNWSQSWEKPALEIVRQGKITTLRLNLVHTKKTVTEPLTYVFGIQPTPIKPLRKDWRTYAKKLDFGRVDGFNGCWLRADDGTHTDFTLEPKDLDWDAVPKRNRFRNRKLMLYLDRAWQRAPADAHEFNHLWRGWGDFTRLFPDVQDAYIYYVNEWIRRGFIDGVYIDDVWIKPTLSGRSGLAYRRDDGEMEWGVEFFDLRNLLKRMRWLFHDNGLEPTIWVHATQTPYIPMLAFVDCMLEGEDRFLPPEHPRNFILCWGVDRIRYSNAAKWGVPSNWMNKIGNDLPGGSPWWYFRQARAFAAALALCDVPEAPGSRGSSRDFGALGMYDDHAEFIGYWDPKNPVKAQTEKCYASTYKLPEHIAVLLVNVSAEDKVADFKVNSAPVKAHLETEAFSFEDADTAKPPEDLSASAKKIGEDPEKQITEAAEGGDAEEEGDPFEEALKEEKKQEVLKTAEGFFDSGQFRFENGTLRIKIRPHDYRLLVIRKATAE